MGHVETDKFWQGAFLALARMAPKKLEAADLRPLLLGLYPPPGTLPVVELVADREQCETTGVSSARTRTRRAYEADHIVLDAAEFLHASGVDGHGVGIGGVLSEYRAHRTALSEGEEIAALRRLCAS